jgi:ADP-heptose:LPS heptosyltransferase
MDPEPIILSRWSGIGDVCMALAAAHAYHATTGGPVYFRTSPELRPLARSCPHLAGVIEDGQPFPHLVREVPLHDARHGLGALHEVDSFCRELRLVGVDPRDKTLDLDPGVAAKRRALDLIPKSDHHRWVVLHPGSRDPNRTWPRAHWLALIRDLFLFGLSVIMIGGADAAFQFTREEVGLVPHGCAYMDLIGRLSILETVALFRRVQALVSTDGGPIQLAGASDVAIVGIYTVVSGSNRLPYRDGILGYKGRAVLPFCSHFPCYQETMDPAVWAGEVVLMDAAGISGLNGILMNWCPAHPPLDSPDRFRCLKQEISPVRVLQAILSVI